MGSTSIIKVENLTKSFKLPHEKQSSLKGIFTSIGRRNKSFEIQKALTDVNFEVNKGEFFGIVGRNGSGKSTLLKLLAGIYTPDRGKVVARGKVTPFIELGVGFNPELTGRENVYLNGALLGFSRREMDGMYQSIVDFSEIERFMDQKLKNYSSGMQVRLAFSIAIQAKSDILILDEVLAVGDEAFQQKCIDVFENYKANHQTVILVTHDMETVKRFCTRAMLLENGEIKLVGNPDTIANEYTNLNQRTAEIEVEKQNRIRGDINIKILNSTDEECTTFVTNDCMTVELQWPPDIGDVKNIGVAIVKQSGEFIFGANTFAIKNKKFTNKAKCTFDMPLGGGKYYIMAGLFGEKESKVIRFISEGPHFIMRTASEDQTKGLVRLQHTWEFGI